MFQSDANRPQASLLAARRTHRSERNALSLGAPRHACVRVVRRRPPPRREVPTNLSPEASALLHRLLDRDPRARLGSGASRADGRARRHARGCAYPSRAGIEVAADERDDLLERLGKRLGASEKPPLAEGDASDSGSSHAERMPSSAGLGGVGLGLGVTVARSPVATGMTGAVVGALATAMTVAHAAAFARQQSSLSSGGVSLPGGDRKRRESFDDRPSVEKPQGLGDRPSRFSDDGNRLVVGAGRTDGTVPGVAGAAEVKAHGLAGGTVPGAAGAAEVKAHAWFHVIDHAKLAQRDPSQPPPLTPVAAPKALELASGARNENFDPQFTAMALETEIAIEKEIDVVHVADGTPGSEEGGVSCAIADGDDPIDDDPTDGLFDEFCLSSDLFVCG